MLWNVCGVFEEGVAECLRMTEGFCVCGICRFMSLCLCSFVSLRYVDTFAWLCVPGTYFMCVNVCLCDLLVVWVTCLSL